MKGTIIHVGVSKTATTTLEHVVFPQHADVEFIGKPFDESAQGRRARPGRLPKATVQALWQDEDADIERIRREIAPFLNTAGDKFIVLSEEALVAGSVVDRRKVAERLKTIFGDATIYITIRSQFTALPSLYLHYLAKMGGIESSFLPWFLKLSDPRHPEHWNLDQFLYGDLVELYREIFGEGAVVVTCFEHLSKDPVAFAESLERQTGLGRADTLRALASGRKHNVGINREAAIANRRIRQVTRFYEDIRTKLLPGFALRKHLPLAWKLKEAVIAHLRSRRRGGDSANPAAITQEGRDAIHAFYSEDNRRFAAMFDLPLDELGYPM